MPSSKETRCYLDHLVRSLPCYIPHFPYLLRVVPSSGQKRGSLRMAGRTQAIKENSHAKHLNDRKHRNEQNTAASERPREQMPMADVASEATSPRCRHFYDISSASCSLLVISTDCHWPGGTPQAPRSNSLPAEHVR